VSGRHQSPHRGASVEFAEYRKYVQGDDPRHLDWRVVARSDRFYLKEFEADTNLRCHLVVDASGSMAYGDKLAYGRRLAGTLAYLAMLQGDAVGLTCCRADITLDIPARRNPAHLRHIFDALAKQSPGGPTGLVKALHSLADKIRRRALVIVISDLFCDPDSLLHCFRHLHYRKHDLAIFHLLHRDELTFHFDRPTRFVDLEGSGSLVVEPSAIQSQYHQALDAYRHHLRRGCFEFRVDYRQVVTDENYETVLANFLLARMKG
jgi:uncharacterized protein (DUF58 family)